MAVQVSPENRGLSTLQSLVDQVLSQGYKANLSVPIVLVSGFSGWGEALFGTFNYWGGFEDLPRALQDRGYTVIVVRIGPLSSNWERACEVYAQLTTRNFDAPDIFPSTTIAVDYGVIYPALYGYAQNSTTKPAVLYGSLPLDWRWSARNPVHFICHSQGGNTIRMLVELMKGTHSDLHSTYFPAVNRQNWTKSVVTLGTPYKGTTLVDVVQGLLPPDALHLITQFVVSVSFRTQRFYDLQLDHWGFARVNNESFSQMQERLKPLVRRWWEGPPNDIPHNGFYDNGVPGVRYLSNFAPRPSPDTFYFTMSFDATVQFPDQSLSRKDLAIFPFPFQLNRVLDPFNIVSGLGAAGLAAASRLPGSPSIVALAKWAVQVANSHLGSLGYFNRIPTPGPNVPRSDMLPIMLPTSFAMGGFENSNNIIATGLPPDIPPAEFQPNDGIVNTVSMRGPNDDLVSDGAKFPIQSLGNAVSATLARARYWHLGVNKTMDHADQIGVFTVGQTYEEVKHMYLLFSQLITRLP